MRTCKFIVQSVLNLAFFALPIAWFTEQMFYSAVASRRRCTTP